MIPLSQETLDNIQGTPTKRVRYSLGLELWRSPSNVIENTRDPGLDDWISSADARWWTETNGGVGTITQNTDPVYLLRNDGGSNASFNKTGSGTMTIDQTFSGLKPGSYYVAEVWHKALAAGGTIKCRLVNTTANRMLRSTAIWGAAAASWDFAAPTISTTWTRSVITFQCLTAFGGSDVYSLRVYLDGTNGQGTNVYVEDLRIHGPWVSTPVHVAPTSVTWQGRTFGNGLLSVGSWMETMDTRTPALDITVSNLGGAFTSTSLGNVPWPWEGGEAIVRLFTWDVNDVLCWDAPILFQGTIEQVKRVTQSEFTFSVVSMIDSQGPAFPSSKTSRECQVRAFGDGESCKYVSTTTANGAGTSSVNLTVTDGTDLENGEYIKIGQFGTEVMIVAGGGTTSITLEKTRTWANADPVIYTRCARAWGKCQKRKQTAFYSGFRGIETLTRAQYRGWTPRNPPSV